MLMVNVSFGGSTRLRKMWGIAQGKGSGEFLYIFHMWKVGLV
jgi:hypothetical protein